jgi:hypothetical protein
LPCRAFRPGADLVIADGTVLENRKEIRPNRVPILERRLP